MIVFVLLVLTKYLFMKLLFNKLTNPYSLDFVATMSKEERPAVTTISFFETIQSQYVLQQSPTLPLPKVTHITHYTV